MPNGYDYSKEYGPHKYREDDGQGDCQHDCGCYMGGHHSGGPIGLDPFGECPANPKDGNLVGGSADHKIVVERRIRKLTSDLSNAEKRAKDAEEVAEKGAAGMQEERDVANKKLGSLTWALKNIHEKMVSTLTHYGVEL